MSTDRKLSSYAAAVIITGLYLTTLPGAYAQRNPGSGSESVNFQGGSGTRGQGPGNGPAAQQGSGARAQMAQPAMPMQDLKAGLQNKEMSPGLGIEQNMEEEVAMTNLEERLQQARDGATTQNKQSAPQGPRKENRVGKFFGNLLGHQGNPREAKAVEIGGQSWQYQPGDKGPGHWEHASQPVPSQEVQQQGTPVPQPASQPEMAEMSPAPQMNANESQQGTPTRVVETRSAPVQQIREQKPAPGRAMLPANVPGVSEERAALYAE